jgi:SDR family mycofactocin-dependent oxidoreductase
MGMLDERVALITGAARGQGRSHALRLAAEGADIIAVDACAPVRTAPYEMGTEADLAETVRQVEALDRRIVARRADVRDLDGLKTAVDEAVAELGRLDIIVANAGIFSVGASDSLDLETWQDMIDVNLTGVWLTTKVAVPHVIAGGRGGSVAPISSIAGRKGMANFAHYVAAKHGVVGLMRTLANELAPHMIRVNSIHPTNVDTPMIQNTACRRLFVDTEEPTKEQFAAAATGMNALPIPWVETEDISNAVTFLTTDMSRYVTGIELPVDGGYHVKA